MLCNPCYILLQLKKKPFYLSKLSRGGENSYARVGDTRAGYVSCIEVIGISTYDCMQNINQNDAGFSRNKKTSKHASSQMRRNLISSKIWKCSGTRKTINQVEPKKVCDTRR